MKKILAMLLVLCMLLSLAACAETPAPTEPQGTQPTEPQGTQPTEPQGTQPTEPQGTQPTEPQGTQPTEPKPTEPKPTEPAPTEPKPTEPIVSGDGPTDINHSSAPEALGGSWNLSQVYVGDTAYQAVANALTLVIKMEEDPSELVDGPAYIHNRVWNLSSSLTFGLDAINSQLADDDIEYYKGSTSWEDWAQGEVVGEGGWYKQPGGTRMQFRDIDDYGLFLDLIAGIEDDIDTTNKKLILGMNKAGQLLLGYSEESLQIPGTTGTWEYVLVFDKVVN